MPPFDDPRSRDTASRFDQPTETFRDEVYRQQRYAGRFEHQSVNSVRSPNFDNPVDHLDRALSAWAQGGFRAAEREYFAAIRAADRIDQREVARERELVKQQLNSERDPAKRRELVQWDATLHDMQRAPGFTRANLGLAYLRMGYQAEGVTMLMEAQRLDPEMANDPNFQRRLRSLNRPLPGFDANYPPGAYDRRDTTVPPTGGKDVTPPTERRDVTPPTERRDVTPPQTTRVELPSGNNRPDAENFDDPFAHTRKANDAFAKAGGKMTPQVKAEYEAGVKAADSIDRKYLDEQKKALQAALEKAFPKETQEKVVALEREKQEMLAKLPEETKKKLQELGKKLTEAKTPEEQEKIKGEMNALVPDVAKKQEEIDRLTAQPKAILEQLKLIELLNNSSALARFAYAEALRQSGDKAGAKAMLEQVIKLDPQSANDAKVKQAAADVGLTIKAPETTTQTETGERRTEGTPERTTTSNDKPDESNPFTHLVRAHDVNQKEGMAAAKRPFEKAIATADSLDQNEINGLITKIEEALKDQSLDQTKKQAMLEVGSQLVNMKHSPFLTRFQYAVALNNAGEHDAAKAMLDEAAQKDPEAAKEAAFQQVVAMVAKKERITDEKLKEVVQASSTTGGAGDSAEAVKQTYAFIKAASDAAKVGNMKTAAEQWQKAIETADKLPVTQFAEQLKQVDAAIKAEQDPVKSQELVKLKEGLKELVDLPVLARMEAARFYLQNAKGDEAKALLEQAMQKNPEFQKREDFKQLAQVSQEISKGGIDKALGFLNKTMKELGSDVISGGGAMAIVAATPARWGLLARGALGLAAGGGIKHTLSQFDFGGDKNNLGKNLLWGGVDFLAVASGSAVRGKLMTSFEKGLSTSALKDITIKGGVSEAEKLMALEGRSGLHGLATLSAMLEKDAAALTGQNLRAMATKAGVAEAEKLAALEAMSGKEGLAALTTMLEKDAASLSAQSLREMAVAAGVKDAQLLAHFEAKQGMEGLKVATQLLTQNIEGKKKLADEALKTAVKDSPWFSLKVWETKPVVWAQGHAPLLWRIPSGSLKNYQAAYADYAAAKGGWFRNYLNPFSVAGRPENFTGTVRNLEARTFWSRYRMDAAGVGAGSLVFRGSHEGYNWATGEVNPETGKPYSAYDAVTNTVVGSATDALTGGFVVAGVRGMGGFFTKHSGAVGEVNPLARPALPETSSAFSWVTSRAAHPFKLAGYGAQKLLVKPIGDGASRLGTWVGGSEGALATGVRTVGPTSVVFSPKLYEIYSGWEKQGEYEKILAEIQKPLTDKLPTDLPAEDPNQTKTADTSGGSGTGTETKPQGEGTKINEGLPE